jgi:hypothetical protein
VIGIDDHSRYCVIVKAVQRATARPVCQTFPDAMSIYGVPGVRLPVTGACPSSLLTGRSTQARDFLPVDHGRRPARSF